MTELIKRSDPRFFEQTYDGYYDRHHYKIVCKNKSVVLESWEEVQEYWWNNMAFNSDMIVEVLDKKRGFK